MMGELKVLREVRIRVSDDGRSVHGLMSKVRQVTSSGHQVRSGGRSALRSISGRGGSWQGLFAQSGSGYPAHPAHRASIDGNGEVVCTPSTRGTLSTG